MLSPFHVVPDIDDLPEDTERSEKERKERQEFVRKLDSLENDFTKKGASYFVAPIPNMPTVRHLGRDARRLSASEMLAHGHLF